MQRSLSEFTPTYVEQEHIDRVQTVGGREGLCIIKTLFLCSENRETRRRVWDGGYGVQGMGVCVCVCVLGGR